MKPIINKITNRIKRFFKEFYRVPYSVPAWGWAEHWAIIRCLITGCIIKGMDKETLYNLIRQKTRIKHVFGFNSGQDAITAALKGWDLDSKDKVVIPSYCCETVAKAVIAAGAQPLFCDIGDDYNPNVEHILKLIDNSVKAVIFPHLFGNPGAIDKLEHALKKKGIRSQILLIDDAAQSFGARLNGRLIGTFGDAGIISFGPGKTMTASGGGILITNNKKLAKKIERLPVAHVFFSNKLKRLFYWVIFRRWRRFTLPFYPFLIPVLKAKPKEKNSICALCNIDAGIAIPQLKKLDKLIQIRIQRKKIVDIFFSDYPDIFYLLAKNDPYSSTFNVATKYIIRYQKKAYTENVQKLYKNLLSSSGVEIQELYIPIHHKTEYSSASNKLKNTEMYYKSLFQIPVEPSISSAEFKFVLKACLKSIKYLCQEAVISDFKHTNAICHGLNPLKNLTCKGHSNAKP